MRMVDNAACQEGVRMAAYKDGIFRVLDISTRGTLSTVKISGYDEITEVREIMIPLETLKEMVAAQ